MLCWMLEGSDIGAVLDAGRDVSCDAVLEGGHRRCTGCWKGGGVWNDLGDCMGMCWRCFR